MMFITVYEDGDIIAIPKDTESGQVDDMYDHYILREGELVKVPWFEASEYQKPFQDKSEWMKARGRTGGRS